MNELIPITTNDQQEPVVSGRMLHDFLEIETPYKKWFDRMVEYGFSENLDYAVLDNFVQNPDGGRPATDHVIKLNMAKELCMIQRTEKGKQARQYFIEVERRFNSPEVVMARALLMANDKIKHQDKKIAHLKEENVYMKPLAAFAESVASSDDSILVREFAKILQQSGISIGEKRLFDWLRDNGYLIRSHSSDWNKPTQRSMELGVMELKTTVIQLPSGETKVRNTPKITGKGQVYFHNKFKEIKNEQS